MHHFLPTAIPRWMQRRQKLMYHLKYLFFNLQLFDPLLVVLITLMRHLHVTVINSFNVCISQRGIPWMTSFCVIKNCISVFIFTTFNAEYSYIYHMRDIISWTNAICLSFAKNAEGFHFFKTKVYIRDSYSFLSCCSKKKNHAVVFC